MIPDCYSALKRMQKRPAMYVGEATLKAIYIYTCGYYQALRDRGLNTYDLHHDNRFHDWVSVKLGYGESTAGWANIILAETLGYDLEEYDIWGKVMAAEVSQEQHNTSIDRFYELLDMYKEEMDNNNQKTKG